jgi:hypothetical protein
LRLGREKLEGWLETGRRRKYFGEGKYVVDIELSLGQTKIYSNAPVINFPKIDVAAFFLSGDVEQSEIYFIRLPTLNRFRGEQLENI